MSTLALTHRLEGVDPPLAIEPAQRAAARLAGLLYLLTMALAIFAESYVRGRLVVRGDAERTAANIAGAERLFRVGIVSDLLTYAGVVALVWCLYVVLRPVGRDVALLAVFFRLVENAVLAVTALTAFIALRLLSGAEYLRVIEPEQLRALARVFLSAYGSGLGIGFVFLGLGSTVFSWLWLRSGYIPRAIAAWGIFSSLALALVTLAIMVFPALGASLGYLHMVPMFFYEVGLGLWLLTRGIRPPSVG